MNAGYSTILLILIAIIYNLSARVVFVNLRKFFWKIRCSERANFHPETLCVHPSYWPRFNSLSWLLLVKLILVSRQAKSNIKPETKEKASDGHFRGKVGEKLLGRPMKTLQCSDVLLIGILDARTLFRRWKEEVVSTLHKLEWKRNASLFKKERRSSFSPDWSGIEHFYSARQTNVRRRSESRTKDK